MGKYDALDDIDAADAEENPPAPPQSEEAEPVEPEAPLPAALVARRPAKYAALDDIDVPEEAPRAAAPAVSGHASPSPLTPDMQRIVADWNNVDIGLGPGVRRGTGTLPQDQPRAAQSAESVGAGEAFSRALGKASSFGFTPALEAATETAASKLGLPGSLPPATYAANRDRILARNILAEQQHPVASGLGAGTGVAATIAPAILSGGALPAAGAVAEAAPSFAGAVGRAALTGAAHGAVQGAAQGTGEAISAGEDFPGVVSGALHGAKVGTVAGAVSGGALTAGGAAIGATRRALAKFVGEAPERAQQWLVNTFVGEKSSFSTKSAKAGLVRDEEGLTALTQEHPEILKAAREAEQNHRDGLGNLIATTQNILEKNTAPREGLYREFAQALPDGGVKAGDFVQHLESEAQKLHDTSLGKDRDLSETINDTIKRIKSGKETGGNRPTFDPSKLTEEDRQILSVYQRQQAKNPTPAGQQAIAAIKSAASTTGFDPNYIITPLKLRQLTTDAQDIAYERLDGLFGNERFTRAKASAAPLEDYLRGIKTEASKANPAAVEAIDAMDAKTSSLLRINKIAKERMNKATERATGTPASTGRVHSLVHHIGGELSTKTALTGAVLLAATGHKELALAVGLPAAVRGTQQVRRALDDRLTAMSAPQRAWLTRVLAGKQAGAIGSADVQGAIQAGVPRALVRALAPGIDPQEQGMSADRALARDVIANQQVIQ